MLCLASCSAPKVIRITAEPQTAAIIINGTLMGHGTAEFTRPAPKEVAVIRLESEGYTPISTKYYGTDQRPALSFNLQQDGFYRSSASSGLVNKFITIDIDPQYYTIDNNVVDIKSAWRMLHQILLNYFDEISTTDFFGGYLQTPWQYKTFELSNKQIRNRVTIRDVSSADKPALQIKIESEVAGTSAARHGEFESIDRIPKELEPMIQELQTRIGKARNL